jgi:DNA-binding response OmpR family regulator
MTNQQAWVLVVDDDASERIVLFRLLEAAGHHATVVDGESALDLLRAEPFDVVLLGPSHDGVLAAVQSDEHLCQTPVIVLSAEDDFERVVADALEAALDEARAVRQ